MTQETILKFWFEELTPKDWFVSSEELDKKITERFSDAHKAAAKNEYWQWRESAEGALAEILVLDQFSRNMFRGERDAFLYDGQALALAQVAVAKGLDQTLSDTQRQFIYMPYMHSESPVVHEEAVRLFTALGNENNLEYEKVHKDIIDQFGRYPHRNVQIGRQSTPDEIEYLEKESKGFFKS